MRHVILPFFLILSLIFEGCTSDDENTNGKLDASQQDKSIADTNSQETTPDGPVVDTGVDIMPDMDPGQPSVWMEVKSSIPGVLHDVYGVTATEVYAVGRDGLIMTYNGSQWSTMTNPDPKKNNLNALIKAKNYLYVVGDGVDLYFDAPKWNQGYTSTSYTYALNDIWCSETSTIIWAATDKTTSSAYLRYRNVSSPTAIWYSKSITGLENINGIWGVSDSEIYAVGDNGTILQCKNCSSSSGSWSLMTSGVETNLQAIWGSSDSSDNIDLFAVGFHGTVLHYDGKKWSKMALNSSTYFYGVWGTSKSNVYVVGHPYFNEDESIFHYNGENWTKLPPPHHSSLNDVWGSSATDIWAVGITHILHSDGRLKP